ncbi:uncharacterized protein FOBCDRAFT_147299 [Fusarium oxysporum Fo47]|uniref:uncharacterized protein n=1 Tax=Fusarium oxysporum Fo47 TaxID=660027 RepID=UPI0028699197|nr:uncharacterized protein FOBCDRAFT_147299 [Fusarium oxysporum Fo47]QKD61304.2 hypothetical protein FOBCDRAFT_147299 [Fusarium oxysporum Fo47]
MTMGPNGDNSPDPRMPTELPLQQLHLTHLFELPLIMSISHQKVYPTQRYNMAKSPSSTQTPTPIAICGLFIVLGPLASELVFFPDTFMKSNTGITALSLLFGKELGEATHSSSIVYVLDGLVSAFLLAYLFDSLRKNVALARTLFFLNSGAGLVAFAYLTAAKGIVTGRDSGTKLLVDMKDTKE